MTKPDDDLRALARTHTVTAVETLVAIMQDAEAPATTRVAAAQTLLDRGWGRAAPRTDSDGDSALAHEQQLMSLE